MSVGVCLARGAVCLSAPIGRQSAEKAGAKVVLVGPLARAVALILTLTPPTPFRPPYSTYRNARTGSALAVLYDCKATVTNATAATAAADSTNIIGSMPAR